MRIFTDFICYLWRSIGKGVLNKTIDVKVQAQKCLNFDVKRFVKYSFSYGKVMKEASLNPLNLSCFICIFLTHGNDGIIETFDKSVKVDELFELFNDCGWNGKPKVFILSVCQGSKIMKGVKVNDKTDGSMNSEIVQTVPIGADFFFAYSAIPGFGSFRNPITGTYYIQAIINQFRQNALKCDINELFMRVNRDLSQNSSEQIMKMATDKLVNLETDW